MACQFFPIRYLVIPEAVMTAPPMTFVARINATGGGDGTICGIGRSYGAGFEWTAYYTLEYSVAFGNVIKAEACGNPSPPFAEWSLTAPNTFTPGTWQNIAAVFASTSSIKAWNNGTFGTENTNSVTPAFIDETIIGTRKPILGPFRPFDGCMVDVAMYNIALSAKQLDAFNAGVSPLLIAPSALVLYWPGTSTDVVTINIGNPNIGNVSPFTVGDRYPGAFGNCADSPRIITPRGFQIGRGTVQPPTPTPTSRRLYFIERMDNRIWPTVEDSWCLDAALKYPMPAPNATLYASSATGDGAIREYNIINGGSNYTSPIGQIEDAEGDGSGATVTFGLTSGVITSATATDIGSDYVRPVLTVLDSTGAGAVVQPIVSNYVTFSATANVFDSGNIGDIIRMGGGQAEVVSVGSGASVTGDMITPITLTTPNDPNATPLPATAGNWTVTTPTQTVSGLAHLEGMTVSALADGGVVGNLTVTDGSVTLPAPATSILVGLPFTAQLQTLYLESNGQGTIQSRRKNIPQAVLRVQNSRAPEIGVNQPDAAVQPFQANVPWAGMAQIKERSVNVLPGQPTPLYSGDYELTNLFGGNDVKGQIAVQQRDPVPLTVLALVPWVTVGDT